MPSKALLFIDLLGYSEMVSNDSEKAKNILSDFYNAKIGLNRTPMSE